MRALLVLLCAMVSLSACSKEVKLVSTSTSQEPVRIEERVVVEMRLSKSDLAKYVDIQDGVWQEARTAGTIKLFNKILSRDLVVVPTSGIGPVGSLDGSYTQNGFVDMTGDEETGDIVQTFMVSASFTTDTALAGQIVSNEESRYLAGMHNVVYAVLYDVVPKSLPAYVVIAEHIGELGSALHRVIGMAEVKQILQEKVALPQDQGGAVGTLCSMEIVVSDREVEAGDMIFLLTTDMTALESMSVPTIDEPDTVVVMPPQTDSVQEPGEKK